MIEVERGTIVVYGDIGCPWAHLAVYRLHRARARQGLQNAVRFDNRAFPLEIFNERPTPRLTLDAEIAVAGGLDPEAGWQLWTGLPHEYPDTTLPAMEAVEVAKEQSLAAAEELDRALRVAFFGESRPISMRHEIVAVARACPTVDADAVLDGLDSGRARRALIEQKQVAESDEVRGSPHLFLPDGTDVHNPGIEMDWHGKRGGFPIIKSDDASVYDEIVRAAAAS